MSGSHVPSEISALRKEIDSIDAALIELLAKRFRTVDRVIAVKTVNDIPALLPERVEEVVRNAVAQAKALDVPGNSIERMWRVLVRETIAYEERHNASRKTNCTPGSAKAVVHVDNDRVIVTEFRFQPGDNTGWHRHGHDYVVVPLMDGKVRLETKNGSSFGEMKMGIPYFREEGVEHDVINATDGAYAFVEIELK
jgi:beta-alanine degradation protein BauB